MASSNGVIDEYGMLTNVLPNGLQLDMITSIKEFIDNSIDANAVHGSDSITSAKREIEYFFSPEEILIK